MIGLSLTAYLMVYVLLLIAYVSALFHLAKKAGVAATEGANHG